MTHISRNNLSPQFLMPGIQIAEIPSSLDENDCSVRKLRQFSLDKVMIIGCQYMRIYFIFQIIFFPEPDSAVSDIRIIGKVK
ncbi:hypothetical protein dsat_1290 [Alkalidesulfovibrio alkalitolerans DSM 16529]|uniref:Uncharacterized protein n=1 Tax=Alkalidesulfovibrio alkalitolerans DSM 16529 TaxID=1121439 RepID=S7UEA6_9BACT|nr:hypothetical protein dsat_1290 [Alkalidesulfovibrio alkalitolerans DSM 16529]